jgi:hypothetical protein
MASGKRQEDSPRMGSRSWDPGGESAVHVRLGPAQSADRNRNPGSGDLPGTSIVVVRDYDTREPLLSGA